MKKKNLLFILGFIIVLIGFVFYIDILIEYKNIAFKWNGETLLIKAAWKEFTPVCILYIIGGCIISFSD